MTDWPTQGKQPDGTYVEYIYHHNSAVVRTVLTHNSFAAYQRKQRIIEAAYARHGDTFADVGTGFSELVIAEDIAVLQRDEQHGGYWLPAKVFVYDDEIEAGAGPSYDIWTSDPFCDNNGWSSWHFEQRFTCEDDDDGRGARRSAHQAARHLRQTYPCSYVAVRPAEFGPPPIPHS